MSSLELVLPEFKKKDKKAVKKKLVKEEHKEVVAPPGE